VVNCGLFLRDEGISPTGEANIAVIERELLGNKQQPPAQPSSSIVSSHHPIPNTTHPSLSAVSSSRTTNTPPTSRRTSQRTRTRQRAYRLSHSNALYLHDALQRKIGIPELPPSLSSLARKRSIYASHDRRPATRRRRSKRARVRERDMLPFFPPFLLESDSACVVCMLVLNMTRGCALRGFGSVRWERRGCACYYVRSWAVHFSWLPFRAATDRHMHAQKHAQRHAYLAV
jgi:hypothetical protein